MVGTGVGVGVVAAADKLTVNLRYEEYPITTVARKVALEPEAGAVQVPVTLVFVDAPLWPRKSRVHAV